MTQRVVAVDALRAMTPDELTAHLREQRGQLFQVRLQQTIGQVENHRQIRAIRKEIARTMTIQVQARLAAERGEPVVVPAPAPAPVEEAQKKRRLGRRSAPAPVTEEPAIAEAENAAEVPVAAADVEPELEAPVQTEAEAPEEIDAAETTDGADAPATDEDAS